MPQLTITVADVKSVIRTSMSEDMIQAFIDVVNEKVGECYAGLSDSLQKILKTHLVAYFIDLSLGNTEVTSRTAPNGASVAYSVDTSRTSLMASPYGRVVISLDTNGCWTSLATVSFGIKAVGC